MFNAGYKKEAIEKCEEASKVYKKEYEDTINKSTELHNCKLRAVEILKSVDTYIHSLSNKPKELQKLASEIAIRRKNFEKEVEELKIESKNADKISKNVAGAGVLTGAGIAAFGPTAAMGIATTFGTASTGTAIASLVGVAQTNAALAWLGGGALAAGGAGMVGGQALLAMAGPIGWAIGGAALIGGGLLANSKNKKIAEKAESQTVEIKKETEIIKEIKTKIIAEIKAIDPLNSGVSSTLHRMTSMTCKDYKKFSSSDKNALIQLMNTAESLSKRIGVKIT